MAGFGIAKLVPRGSGVIYLLFVLGLTLPFEGIITPLYYEVRWMGILNTKFAIILPLIGLYMPFSVYWMRAHFVNVPADISEAAEVDGASAWQHFWRIQVPMARPAITSLAILQFLWTWNQFLLPVVLVENPLERTMGGALGAFQGQWGTNIPLLCAGSLIIIAPTVLLFLIFQRQFVAALLQGAVKG
jgi:raffinose/stachyose/melibiose transport system permease protein